MEKKKLNVILISSIRDFFGFWVIDILINGKQYTYSLTSEAALNSFNLLIKHRRPGKALAVLKKFNREECKSC